MLKKMVMFMYVKISLKSLKKSINVVNQLFIYPLRLIVIMDFVISDCYGRAPVSPIVDWIKGLAQVI
jgi:hypothetical protein